MERTLKYFLGLVSFLSLALFVWVTEATTTIKEGRAFSKSNFNFVIDTPPPNLIYPLPLNTGIPDTSETYSPPLHLSNPPNIYDSVVYDPDMHGYMIYPKVGSLTYREPFFMSFEDYFNYNMNSSLQNYWREKVRSSSSDKSKSLIPSLHIGGKAFDKIFGSNTIDIRPQGSAELIFGVNASRRDDPALDVKQRRTANFDFQEKIQMNVVAKIGDKIELGTNYNTEATFDFENKMKLAYEGKEDEIIKIIEAGDVTLPLNGTLISGSQSLFGIKAGLQFGRTTITSIFSQQKSETTNITVAGGAQTNTFELKADQYEENKHFFVSQYFRNKYNHAMQNLPVINSSINITKIEVWATNIGAATTENRNIVAFSDIGEYSPYNNVFSPNPGRQLPSNNSNNLTLLIDTNKIRDINNISSYLNSGPLSLVSGVDYEKVENARKLSSTEYSFNSKLGFISLNTHLNSDQVLAVAYQYTIIGDTTVYQVGEFSNGGVTAPNCLMVKLLKSTAVNTNIPLWNLMMKNVYAIGGYQINNEDFRLNVLYTDDEHGVPTGYLTESSIKGIPYIRLLNCDNLNTLLDPTPDGVFDFIDNAATQGGTVQTSNGRIFFPVLEPFGSDLYKKFDPADSAIAKKYVYQELYNMTKNGAQQYPSKNKFLIQGTYKSSSSSEISLNAMNIPQGSVKVTAGGIPLTENVDFTVDYTLGRLKIINEGILNSGTPINISLESNSLFNIQTKTMMGTHIDYKVNRNFNLGATLLNLTERPLTQKINFGDEPISNTIWGFDATYETESRLLTKLIDKLPFIDTKTPSNISFNGEFAQLIPGHSRAIGKTGTSYIDDFEGSKSSQDIKNIGAWFLSSTPQGQAYNGGFPEAMLNDNLAYGFNRAKLAWYVIDPLFVRNNNITPDHIKNDKEQQSNHYVREVLETEVFPNKEVPNGQPMNIAVLNLAFYPKERGPYNYDVLPTPWSAGINADGELLDPWTRWGGIMRRIETTDFEATNVEYIEFWMMDPFIDPDGSGSQEPIQNGGYLYFNLGDISEDVLKDGRKSYENGLPTSEIVQNVDTTIWGRVPTMQALVNSFDNDPNSRVYQDVGLDGLGNNDEISFFDSTYLQKIANAFTVNSSAYAKAVEDPSSDNYHYFRGSNLDNDQVSILDRYKKYNGMEGNSPTSEQSPESYTTSATTLPNVEDINRDNTLSETERYFEYRVDLQPNKMNVGQNYITDVFTATVTLANGNSSDVKWYQFKIPVQSPDKVIGNIQDFKSIRFMRMYLKGFSENAVLRFATLDLVRGTWRKYNYSLLAPGEYIPGDQHNNTTFDISAVNIEENGKRTPVPYVLPPGIERELNLGTTNLQKMNEQALVVKVCELIDGDARAAYKTSDFDMRQYKRLKMFVHAEAAGVSDAIKDGDLTAFIRLGTDFTDNFYEYEIPLKFTPWGTSAVDQLAVWPEENEFDIELDLLVQAKQDRNTEMRQDGSTLTPSTPYYAKDGNNTIMIVGMPNLASVKTIMIGIRNPKKKQFGDGDDGLSKCAEIWFNELRLTDFNDKPGWAATARVSTNLADLGTLVLAGSYSTPGFGSIDKKVNERQKEEIINYDVATNIELGKFFPESAGLKIPLHFDFSESVSNPQYNPLNPDIELKSDLKTFETKAEKDSIKHLTQDYTRRKNINFMNMRKVKTGGNSKNYPWSIENFDFTYAYSEIYHRSIDIEYDIKKTYKGAIGYNFTINPKPVRPFNKSKFLNKYKTFAIIKDFNFNYLPKLLSFRTDMDRMYNENMLRNKSSALILMEPTFVKTFSWNRYYDFKYDITQALNVDYHANVNSRIDEPPGRIDEGWKKDSVWNNIKSLGRKTTFDHNFNVNYNIPINKIPLFNWLTTTARYGGEYHWTAAPLSATYLGNTIENSNTKQINANANLTNLYNKIGYLRKLNQNADKNKIQGRNEINKLQDRDSLDEPKKEPVNYAKIVIDNILRLATGFKNASFSYSENNGTLLPGFKPSPFLIGLDSSFKAPGPGFVFGEQNGSFPFTAAKNGWLSSDSAVNSPIMRKHSQNINARITYEPFKNFRVEITANRNFSRTNSEYFRADSLGRFNTYAPVENGSFSISYLTWNTAFITDDKKTYSSENFENFKQYRYEIAMRLAQDNPNWNGKIVDSTGFPDGYGPTSQDVLIPAFLAAYTGRNPGTVNLNTFPKIPLPNWRLTFTGLTNIKAIKKYFKSISIGHGYRSSYNVGNYTSNVLYRADDDGFQTVRDAVRNYIPEKEIAQISITEQFNPLFNLDMTWNNSLITKIEFKKSRNLSLSFANNQLTEITSNEIIIGSGYRIKDVTFDIRSGGRKRTLKSDLSLKADLSIRTNKTVLRKLVENIDQISAGQTMIAINISADYNISTRFTVRAFFDKNITNPFVSSQFPNSNTNAGISLRFTLAQ